MLWDILNSNAGFGLSVYIQCKHVGLDALIKRQVELLVVSCNEPIYCNSYMATM